MSIGLVTEARWYGSLFLRQMASVAPPVADDLEVAAECFVDQHDLTWAVWEFARHGEPAEHPRRFATSWTRERILPLLRTARQNDELAVARLEQAVAKLQRIEPPVGVTWDWDTHRGAVSRDSFVP